MKSKKQINKQKNQPTSRKEKKKKKPHRYREYISGYKKGSGLEDEKSRRRGSTIWQWMATRLVVVIISRVYTC